MHKTDKGVKNMIHSLGEYRFLPLVFTICLSLQISSAYGQVPRGWGPFEGVKFEPQYDESIDDYVLLPDFSADILAKQGKVVELTGYYVPFDLDDGAVILSRYPYAQCFFCGNAGPGSVAEVYFKQQGLEFLPDQLISVSGILKLNTKDANHLNFILEQAELVEIDN